MHHLPTVTKWIQGEQIYPIHVEISPSSGCNHRCVLCCVDYKRHKPQNLSEEVMKRLSDDLKEASVKSFLLAGEGEPLLNKYCVDLIKRSTQNGIDSSLTTNGVLFTQDISKEILGDLSWMRFSIQASTPKLYSKLHGTSERDFEKVKENVRRATELKKKNNLETKIGIQQIIINENWDDVLGLAKLSKELGVDYFTVKRFSKHPNNTYDVPEDLHEKSALQFKEAEKLTDDSFMSIVRWNQFKEQPREYKNCLGLPFITQILASGEIYPCCQFFDTPERSFGDLNVKTFKEIFDSERTKFIMKDIQENYDVSKCMSYCRHHSTNIFLSNLKDSPEHVNFI